MGTAQAVQHPATRQTSEVCPSAGAVAVPWWRSSLAQGLLGHAFWWIALPPLGLAPAAFLAPVAWVLLIRQPVLPGRRPYLALWLSSFVFWLAALYWLTLPHWATGFGLLALSFYLALYFPLFIGLCRVAVHACRVSPLLAAPVVWTGLELVRGHVLGGFSMASLSHTQYRWTDLLQISDWAGAYGVSCLILFVGACAARMLPCGAARRAWWPAIPAAAALGAALAYGHFRTTENATSAGPRVALVQGSIDIELKYDPAERQRIFDEYFKLSKRAVRENANLDLIVWPETMFRDPWYVFDAGVAAPADTVRTAEQIEADSRRAIEITVSTLGVPCLLGIDTVHFKSDGVDRFNTALFADRAGTVVGRYDKCHLVMFGEYVPLADRFPWLYHLTPLPGGANAGAGPRAVTIGSTRYAANICYENTVPQLIRRQVEQLAAEHQEPDVLVNLTNDGWFWGSSELDLHLACAVFRAIECRKPFLIAANTGFSAWIDSNGRIRAQGPRRATDVIIADVEIDHRHSGYLRFGDLPAGACLVLTGAVAIVGLGQRWRRRRI